MHFSHTSMYEHQRGTTHLWYGAHLFSPLNLPNRNSKVHHRKQNDIVFVQHWIDEQFSLSSHEIPTKMRVPVFHFFVEIPCLLNSYKLSSFFRWYRNIDALSTTFKELCIKESDLWVLQKKNNTEKLHYRDWMIVEYCAGHKCCVLCARWNIIKCPKISNTSNSNNLMTW